MWDSKHISLPCYEKHLQKMTNNNPHLQINNPTWRFYNNNPHGCQLAMDKWTMDVTS